MNLLRSFLLTLLFINKLHSAEAFLVCDIVNYSDRKIEIWKNDTNCLKRVLFSDTLNGSKHFVVKLEMNEPSVIFFNNYLFYVHPYDTVQVYYQRLYSTGYDSLSIQGKHAQYYLFFYKLLKTRTTPPNWPKYSSDSLWLDYSRELQDRRKQEMDFLDKYARQYFITKKFYLIAFSEIKFQYIINSLLPNYGLGFDKNNSTKIPDKFYNNFSDEEFSDNILSNTFITALDLYNKYLTDKITDHKFNRYSSEYLSALFKMAGNIFHGVTKKVLLLRIINEYQIIGIEAYLPVYTDICEKIRKWYPYPQTLNFVDSLYNLVIVLNKTFPDKIKHTLLTNLTGEQTTFGDIIDKYRGKVIYADFWATWCIPCIHEMANSILMQNRFKYKDVVFVFFSLDDKGSMTHLIKVSSKLRITENQYLVNRGFDSELSNFINVGAIPAHFIVDKYGNLVTKSAPGPNTSEANKIVDELLLK